MSKTTILALCVALGASAAAAADDYPSRPIHLLVGFSPGGGLDISCRHSAQRLSARIGQPVVVENRPGASGELSVKAAMAAKPDGYTLVCLSGSNTISASKPNPPFVRLGGAGLDAAPDVRGAEAADPHRVELARARLGIGHQRGERLRVSVCARCTAGSRSNFAAIPASGC